MGLWHGRLKCRRRLHHKLRKLFIFFIIFFNLFAIFIRQVVLFLESRRLACTAHPHANWEDILIPKNHEISIIITILQMLIGLTINWMVTHVWAREWRIWKEQGQNRRAILVDQLCRLKNHTRIWTFVKKPLSGNEMRCSRDKLGVQLAAILPLSEESDYCVYWIYPIEIKHLISVHRYQCAEQALRKLYDSKFK